MTSVTERRYTQVKERSGVKDRVGSTRARVPKRRMMSWKNTQTCIACLSGHHSLRPVCSDGHKKNRMRWTKTNNHNNKSRKYKQNKGTELFMSRTQLLAQRFLPWLIVSLQPMVTGKSIVFSCLFPIHLTVSDGVISDKGLMFSYFVEQTYHTDLKICFLGGCNLLDAFSCEI